MRALEIFLLLQCGDPIDFRRQILSTKVHPRAVRVKALAVMQGFWDNKQKW